MQDALNRVPLSSPLLTLLTQEKKKKLSTKEDNYKHISSINIRSSYTLWKDSITWKRVYNIEIFIISLNTFKKIVPRKEVIITFISKLEHYVINKQEETKAKEIPYNKEELHYQALK